MDKHARKFGLFDWKCIDPKSNSMWQRKDGLRIGISWSLNDTYMDDLREVDKLFPMDSLFTIKDLKVIRTMKEMRDKLGQS